LGGGKTKNPKKGKNENNLARMTRSQKGKRARRSGGRKRKSGGGGEKTGGAMREAAPKKKERIRGQKKGSPKETPKKTRTLIFRGRGAHFGSPHTYKGECEMEEGMKKEVEKEKLNQQTSK